MLKRFALGVMVTASLAAGCTMTDKQKLQDSADKVERSATRQARKAEKTVQEAATTTRIKAVLIASSKLDSSKINVDTVEKVVYLRGTVFSAEQKTLALRLAQDTAGKDEEIRDELKIDVPAH